MEEFPRPLPDDNEDVAWALQTAHTMFERGDLDEAARWLQRAATAAEEAGDDMRLLTLARAAADLAAHTRRVAAPAPPAPAPAPAQPPPRRPATTQLGLGQRAPTPAAPPAAAATPPPLPQTPAAPAVAPVATPPPLPQTPAAPAVAAVAAPPPLPVAAPAPAPAPSPAPPPVERSPMPPPVAPTPAHAARVEPRHEPTRPAHVPSVHRGDKPAALHGLRVSVNRSPTQRGTLIVHALADGEDAPPGSREAVLIPLQPDVDLLD